MAKFQEINDKNLIEYLTYLNIKPHSFQRKNNVVYATYNASDVEFAQSESMGDTNWKNYKMATKETETLLRVATTK